MSALRTLLLAGLAAGLASAAQATPIVENLTVSAAGFSDLQLFGGPASPVPVDPATLTFSISFDPAAGDQFGNTAGIVLLSGGNVPVDGGVSFDYDSAADELTLGGAGLSGIGITAGTNDVLITVDQAFLGTPVLTAFDYVSATSSTGVFESLTGTAVVPEPTSLAVLLTGVAALARLRRRAA